MITTTTSLVRDPNLISTALGEEVAMLHIDSGRYFFLNDIAAEVWEDLESPTTPAALCASLTDRYDVPAAQCETEVLSLLSDLLKKKLIRLAE